MLFQKKPEGYGQTFDTLGLKEPIMKALFALKYKKPTEIQAKAVPAIIEGRDIIACAKTGTGKTAAFTIPLVDRLEQHSEVVGARALIIVPTRDLAMQTLAVVKDMTRFTDLRKTLIVGGHTYEGQFESLASNPDIIIATPGRLMQLLEETQFSLKKVEYLVFDEADSLFEMGFAEQVRGILKKVSNQRQTLLFSATIPKELSDFAAAGLNDYRLIRLNAEYTMPDKALLHFLMCRTSEKLSLLILLLQRFVQGKTIVFCPTKQIVEFLVSLFPHFKITCVGIYGKMDNETRVDFMSKFKVGNTQVLIVTDLAARGIDIPSVKHVINFGYPQNSKTFIHRCGRTARAGRSGTAWTILGLTEKNYLSQIEMFLDRKLRNDVLITGSGIPHFESSSAYYGRVKQEYLLEFIEVINDLIKDDLEIFNLHKSALNSMKKFERTREKTALAAAKNLDKVDLEHPHPLFKDMDTQRADAINEIKAFKPVRSYLELSSMKDVSEKSKDILQVVEKMKKLQSRLGKKLEAKKLSEEDKRRQSVANLQRQKERDLQLIEAEKKQQEIADRYKSPLFISNQENPEKMQAFYSEEKITREALDTFTMEPQTEQLFEHRKFIWDQGRRTYKKLKVDGKGHVVRENLKRDKSELGSVEERYKRWKKTNFMGIQREGEAETKTVSDKARSLLAKRTKGTLKHEQIKAQGEPKMKKRNMIKKGLMKVPNKGQKGRR